MPNRAMPLILAGVLIWAPGLCQADETTRIQPENLVYQGAFRLPAIGPEEYNWAWADQALTYRPDGRLSNRPRRGKFSRFDRTFRNADNG